MLPHKRAWIYAGMGVPLGVAVARAPTVQPPGPKAILLCGTESAAGLAPALGRLASEHGVELEVDARPGTTAEMWCTARWLDLALDRARPDLVLLGIDLGLDRVGALALLGELAAEATRHGARAAWLPWRARADVCPTALRVMAAPAVPSHADGPLLGPSAVGYAAWAGTVWQQLYGSRSHHG